MRVHSFAAAVVAACLVVASTATAATRATTTVTFDNPAVFGAPLNRTFDALAIDWSTPKMSGEITAPDLTDLTFRLLNGGTTRYTDAAIVGGVAQPIGSVARNVSDIEFAFDLNSLPNGLFFWDNDVNVLQDGAASGETYNVYGLEIVVLSFNFIDGYSGGALEDSFESGFTQSTVIVPEPSTLYGGLVMTLAGFNCSRRPRPARSTST
jgi:hypothetical protein